MKQRILILLLALVMLVSVLSMGAFAEDMVTDSDYDGIPDALDNQPDSNTFCSAYDEKTVPFFCCNLTQFWNHIRTADLSLYWMLKPFCNPHKWFAVN